MSNSITLQELFASGVEPEQWVLDMLSAKDYELPLTILPVAQPGKLLSSPHRKTIENLEEELKSCGPSSRRVARLTRYMQAGTFPDFPEEDILIVLQGQLLDGHHRAYAAYKAGIPLRMVDLHELP